MHGLVEPSHVLRLVIGPSRLADKDPKVVSMQGLVAPREIRRGFSSSQKRVRNDLVVFVGDSKKGLSPVEARRWDFRIDIGRSSWDFRKAGGTCR